MIILKARDIEGLANMIGLEIKPSSIDTSEIEVIIDDCPAEGIINDDGDREFWDGIAYLAEYPEEGVIPLGKKLPSRFNVID